MELTEEKYIKDYPFLQYINEDKSHYKHAKDCGGGPGGKHQYHS